jgi:class 3 adenylate cyclase/tetratricopeptide (TPR) repeat protein
VQPADQHERPERRKATVLFCDLGGYTAWTEREEPEEVAAVMDRIKQQAALTFESFGGIANQFVGDEIIGLFGVTQSHEDDPRRAVAAAQALHAFVREQLHATDGGPMRELRMHSGIETGVIYARTRDPRSGLWEITGDTVNVAARLRALAAPDEVLIGPGTQAAVAQFFATEALPAVSVRGRQQQVVAHRVRAAAASSRFEVSEQRGLTKYVGRELALQRLQAVWQDACRGSGRLVTIEGPAGIGKTRLLHELRRLVGAAAGAARGSSAVPPRILHGRCQDFGNVPPYQPFVEALGELALDAGELSGSARDALRCLREPGALPARFQDAAGEQLRDAISAALFELCAALARQSPLLIVFEDWHLADEPSRVALRHIAQGIDRCHALIAVNFRPGEIGASLRALSALHETLAPFDEPSTAAIAQGVLHAAPLPPGLSRHIFERSLGNPFFAEEVARSLLENGALARLPGSVVLVKPLAQLATPATVQAVVRERVDRLPAEQRNLLRAASVVGVEFGLPLLSRLLQLQQATHGSDLPVSEVSCLLDELERQGLLYRSSSDEAHYRFRHAITQEVVYESLPLYERRALHELVARSSEDAHLESGREPPCEMLAHHYGHSLNLHKALHYAELAGDKAWRAFALQQADAHYRRALELLDATPGAEPATARRRLDLTLRWARIGVYNPRAELARALRVARATAESAGDARGACLCLNWLSWLEYARGNQPESLAFSLEFLKAAERLGDGALVAQALTNAGLCHSVATEYRQATDFIELGIALRGRFAGTAYAYALGTMAMLRGDQGDFKRAFDLAQRAVTITDQSGRLTLQGPVLTQRGMIEAWSGAFEACANTGAAVHDIAEHIDGNYLRAMGRSLEGYARFMLSGDPSAIDLQREAVTLLERHGISLHMSWCLALLAETLSASSQHDEARAAVDAALKRAADHDRLGEAHALRVMIRLHGAGAADLGAAERCYRRALELAEAKHSPRDRALSDLSFGLLLRRCGEHVRGDALVLAANAALTGMGCDVGERLRTNQT